jgi:hypothetical protein
VKRSVSGQSAEKIIDLRQREVTRGYKKLHKDKINNLYSLNIKRLSQVTGVRTSETCDMHERHNKLTKNFR